jgi:hypothetical protein
MAEVTHLRTGREGFFGADFGPRARASQGIYRIWVFIVPHPAEQPCSAIGKSIVT